METDNKIYITKFHNEHYEASADDLPLEARFGAKTADQAVENMIAWFERMAIRSEEIVEKESKDAVIYKKTAERLRTKWKNI